MDSYLVVDGKLPTPNGVRKLEGAARINGSDVRFLVNFYRNGNPYSMSERMKTIDGKIDYMGGKEVLHIGDVDLERTNDSPEGGKIYVGSNNTRIKLTGWN